MPNTIITRPESLSEDCFFTYALGTELHDSNSTAQYLRRIRKEDKPYIDIAVSPRPGYRFEVCLIPVEGFAQERILTKDGFAKALGVICAVSNKARKRFPSGNGQDIVRCQFSNLADAVAVANRLSALPADMYETISKVPSVL
ncbi:hypothetical protein [Nostoc sp. MG11]|uniref:hypothetical protein n=1 Tax=Nostoc sp. MG11 TaxID=2721166 RepID=UPI001868D93C|nr:hypothetical protein [Nostoc sp. MG11]